LLKKEQSTKPEKARWDWEFDEYVNILCIILSKYMNALIAATIVSLLALAGLFTFSFRRSWIDKISFTLVAIAAGTFLGDAFFHLIPEALELGEDIETKNLFVFTLTGMVVFFILEEVVHWHHHVEDLKGKHPKDTHHLKPIAVTNLIGDGLHNFMDGIAIAASFSISNEVGIATLIAIILHEIPQELADFGILIYSGLSSTRALIWNFISGLLSILGVAVFLVFETAFENIEQYVLALIAGVFIYIASTDLFPEIHKNKRVDLLQILYVIIGIGAMYALTLME